MIPLSTIDMQMIIATTAFILGCMCVLLGIFVLVSRGYSKEIRALATHSARLGRKGMADEVTGLVYSLFRDRWTLGRDLDVNYMLLATKPGDDDKRLQA